MRELNKTAVHEHALECSRAYRNGKFTRVGEDFHEEIAADVESVLRDLRNKSATLHPALLANGSFVTGEMLDKVRDILNELIGRMVQNKTQRQPSCGVTLGRTR